jgi:solute:Na+ symporter, SSS family
VLVGGLGRYIWLHFFAATFTVENGQILRRNNILILMPLYALTLPLMLLVGLTAVLVLQGLRDGDLSVLLIVRKTFPAWFLGMVGGAGTLTAMVATAIQRLCGATLYAKNLFRPIFAPRMTEQQVALLSKLIVLALTAAALLLSIYSSVSLVSLLPGVFLELFSRRATTAGVFAGLFTGAAIAVILTLTNRDPFHGLNAGFIGLRFNFAVTAAVSALTPMRVAGFDEISPAFAASQTGAGAGLT